MDLIIIEEAYKEDLSEITGEINLKGNFGVRARKILEVLEDFAAIC